MSLIASQIWFALIAVLYARSSLTAFKVARPGTLNSLVKSQSPLCTYYSILMAVTRAAKRAAILKRASARLVYALTPPSSSTVLLRWKELHDAQRQSTDLIGLTKGSTHEVETIY